MKSKLPIVTYNNKKYELISLHFEDNEALLNDKEYEIVTTIESIEIDLTVLIRN